MKPKKSRIDSRVEASRIEAQLQVKNTARTSSRAIRPSQNPRIPKSGSAGVGTDCIAVSAGVHTASVAFVVAGASQVVGNGATVVAGSDIVGTEVLLVDAAGVN